MFNILLDEYPTEWNSYKLNTDFRVGVQMVQATEDKDLSDYEKLQVMVMLLFTDEHPNTEESTECIEWFLNEWNHDHHQKGGVKSMDFDVDQGRIYSAFLSQYHIDLNNTNMHFWKFMYLLSNLEECAFTRVVEIRTKKIDAKMSKEEKILYSNAKKTYAIESEEDKQAEDDTTKNFLSALGVK